MSSSRDPFLRSLGWDDFFQATFDELGAGSLRPARIVGQGKGHYHLQIAPNETFEAAITSRLHAAAREAADFPTVGDWVAYVPGVGKHHATIHHVLKRKSCLQRRRARTPNEMQLIAANVDSMFVVTSCNEDFDLPRIGRYVALAKDSFCAPVLVLSKVDVCAEPEKYLGQLRAEFPTLEIFALSARVPDSIEALRKFFESGKTVVLLGSSGVGKSTLTNELLGTEVQRTQAITAEAKGRHTTTARNLRFTRWGGLVMDTPGMQEIAEVVREEDLQKDFSDVEELTLRCKFTTCQHKNEPGCAIQAALKAGELASERWQAYQARAAAAVTNRPPRKRK